MVLCPAALTTTELPKRVLAHTYGPKAARSADALPSRNRDSTPRFRTASVQRILAPCVASPLPLGRAGCAGWGCWLDYASTAAKHGEGSAAPFCVSMFLLSSPPTPRLRADLGSPWASSVPLLDRSANVVHFTGNSRKNRSPEREDPPEHARVLPRLPRPGARESLSAGFAYVSLRSSREIRETCAELPGRTPTEGRLEFPKGLSSPSSPFRMTPHGLR